MKRTGAAKRGRHSQPGQAAAHSSAKASIGLRLLHLLPCHSNKGPHVGAKQPDVGPWQEGRSSKRATRLPWGLPQWMHSLLLDRVGKQWCVRCEWQCRARTWLDDVGPSGFEAV